MNKFRITWDATTRGEGAKIVVLWLIGFLSNTPFGLTRFVQIGESRMSFIKQCNPVAVSHRWVLACIVIAALLAATFAASMSPKQIDAQGVCPPGFPGPILQSLSMTDQNGDAVNLLNTNVNTNGLNTLHSLAGSVESDVTYVTLFHSVGQCRLRSEVLPPDSNANANGHQVPLQHGNNSISIVLMTFDPVGNASDSLRVLTYEIRISRAGSPSETSTPVISAYGLRSGFAKRVSKKGSTGIVVRRQEPGDWL